MVTDLDGRAVEGAHVYVYRRAVSGLRGPADFEAVVDEQGEYFLDLPQGRYHLVARKRFSGKESGPPRPGDLWGVYPENPVEVASGYATLVDLRMMGGEKPMLRRQGESVMKNAAFSGMAVDGTGDPVEGLFVLAYRDAEFKGSPAFISLPTDRSGRFFLSVEGPGRYCLVVRSKIRGQILLGELFGQPEEVCIDMEAGETKGVGRVRVAPRK